MGAIFLHGAIGFPENVQQAAFAFCLLAGIASCCAVSYLFGLHAGRDAAIPAVSVRVDTLTIRDTIREKYPVPVTRWRTRTELVPVRDTVRPRHFGFGITAGPGALWDGSGIRGGLGVTAGLTVRF